MSKKALVLSIVLMGFAADYAYANDAGTVDTAVVVVDAVPPIVVATTPPADEDSVVDSAKGAITSLKGGKAILGLGFIALFLGAVGRKLVGLKWNFWKSKAGGYTIAVFSGLTLFGTGTISNGSFSLDVLLNSVVVVLVAMGLHGPAKSAKAAATK
ncbi:MAG: hypothetical protein Q8S00_32340 [Deltaproteobacteria bacterium]|nr:hypothetical protein [Deltaproteobacteria bacterium]